jgi:type I restriction enzyme S subunit
MAATKNTKAFYTPKAFGAEIPSDWTVMPLGALGTFSKGKGILKEQVISEGLPCVRYGEIYTTHDFIIKEFKSFIAEDVATESKEIKNGDILFAGSGETVEEIGKAVAYIGTEKAYAGGDVIILSTRKDVNPKCLSYALETDFVKRQKRVLGQGNSVVHIYPSDLSKVKIPLPPLPEQKAIAQVLSTADAAIHTTERLIAQKELRKKWLMQQLLTGKKRLKGFEGEWKEIHIRDVAKEVSIRNKSDKQLTVLSCTKYDGLVPHSNTLEGRFLLMM